MFETFKVINVTQAIEDVYCYKNCSYGSSFYDSL